MQEDANAASRSGINANQQYQWLTLLMLFPTLSLSQCWVYPCMVEACSSLWWSGTSAIISFGVFSSFARLCFFCTFSERFLCNLSARTAQTAATLCEQQVFAGWKAMKLKLSKFFVIHRNTNVAQNFALQKADHIKLYLQQKMLKVDQKPYWCSLFPVKYSGRQKVQFTNSA